MRTTYDCILNIKMKFRVPQSLIPVKTSNYLTLILEPKHALGSQPESTSYCLLGGNKMSQRLMISNRGLDLTSLDRS